MFEQKSTEHLSRDDRLQQLLDENDIRNVLRRDCRSKSRGDVELMLSCFHDNAPVHMQPFFDGTAESLRAGLRPSYEASEMWHYAYPQILVELDGDIARTESLVWSVKTFRERAENGDKIMGLHGGRFLDRFERRNGDWRIAERWYHHEWGFFQQVPPMTEQIGLYTPDIQPPDLSTGLTPFARDKADLSYSPF